MRILFLTRSFNGLTQRLFLELTALGHEVSVELDISDEVTLEAVTLFRPALIVAPFLRRAIPEAVWRETRLPRRAPGDRRRPRAIGARLGDHERRNRMGRHRVAGKRRDGRRPGVGSRDLCDARRDEVEPVPRGSHRSRGPRGRGSGAALRGRRCASARSRRYRRARPLAAADAAGRPAHRLAARRHANRAAQDPRCRRRAGCARQPVRHALPPVRRARACAGSRP